MDKKLHGAAGAPAGGFTADDEAEGWAQTSVPARKVSARYRARAAVAA
ncbi:MAG: hypothetical protein IKZ87_01500 [Actinomycetaceae bacterium]|nr:hypothetical protein [Actinomycetaceae bacterium]